MADQDTTWTWNFTGPTTMSKAQSRPSTPKEIAWDLTGFDGNETGCLRTHPGFRRIVAGITTYQNSNVFNFFPITLTYDSTNYIVGFVLVTRNQTHLNFEFFLSSDGVNVTKVEPGGLPVHQIANANLPNTYDLSELCDVQTIGRYVYLFFTGQPVQVIYLSAITPSYTLVKVQAGPGIVPTVEEQWMITPDNYVPGGTGINTINQPCGVARVTITNGGSGYTNPPLVTFSNPPTLGHAAKGYAKIANGSVTEVVVQEQGSGYVVGTPATITFSGGGGASATCVMDPDQTNGNGTSGRMSIMYQYDTTPLYSTTNATLHASGSYGFAVQFLDSTTGRKTQISEIKYVKLNHNLLNGRTLYFPIQFRVWFPSTYSGGVWTRGTYDKALIYRTVNQGKGGGTQYGSAPLHLDNIVTASSDLSVVCTPRLYVMTSDGQLIYQDTFAGRTRSDSTPPQGGTAQFLGSTLFVSRILGNSTASATDSVAGVTPALPIPGVGDLRWSSTLDAQPEIFSPFNRWVPQTPGNEIIAMRRVGPVLIGFSTDRMYRISRADSFIKVEEMHVGYGLSSVHGLESIGTMAYFISGSGLKAISGDGQLEDVTSLDSLFNGPWLGAKTKIKMAFDAVGQCLTILKPRIDTVYTTTSWPDSSGQAVCLWFGTNRVTMLEDLPFRFVKTGNWIFYPFITGSTQPATNQRRALFVKKDNTTWGIYVVDHERIRGSNKNLCGGPARVLGSTGNPSAAFTDIEYDCYGYYSYNPQLKFELNDYSFAPPAGQPSWWSSVGTFSYYLAPILQKWGGGNLGFQLQPDQPEFKDFFRQKQVVSCRAYIEAASGAVGALLPQGYDALLSWFGTIHEGTNTTPLVYASPRNKDGTYYQTFSPTVVYSPDNVPVAPFGAFDLDAQGQPDTTPHSSSTPSPKYGAIGASLSPGFVFCVPGVDIKLLAFSVTGRILDTQRRRV